MSEQSTVQLDPYKTIKCEVCGAYVGSISPAHLKKHGLTFSEYVTLYPNSPTRSQYLKDKQIANGKRNALKTKGVSRSQDVKDKISQTKKANPTPPRIGFTHSEDTKRLLSEKIKQRYDNGAAHWNQGNVTPDSVKDKISSTAKAQNRKYSSESVSKRNDTLNLKKLSGWVPPGTRRKGIKIIDVEVLEKIRKVSKETNRKKSEAALQQIQELCNTEKLSILEIEDNYWFHMKCLVCNTDFLHTRQMFRPCTKNGKELCPTCYPRKSGTSIKEQEVAQFISTIYSGRIIQNDRVMLNGKELDIYLPELNLAIEFNGLYWHSENNFSGHKHHLLYKQQYAYKKGIRVIHIMEDEWDHKRDIVKSRLTHLLDLQTTRLHARKCVVRDISSQQKDQFLIENHIMGKDVSGIRYGAFYEDELVAVMTFTKTNYVKGGDGVGYELNRFAIKKYHHISGLASKMFKHFINECSPTEVISYCDRRWNAGESYSAMGFTIVGTTPPSYWYMPHGYGMRLHRSNFMKHKIVTPETETCTEWEIMTNSGYDRIWDCGTLKFIWTGQNI